ncbi:MAG TPA: sulfite exporter TauE/SafE family protein [Vicinamibacterales bacterium]
MLLASLGALLIGISKSGFASGLGMLTTPLVASAMPARDAIGLVLPLLCVADVFTIGFYWKKWDAAVLKHPLAGAVLGIAMGMLVISRVSNRMLALSIGLVGVAMVVLLIVRGRWFPEAVYRPGAVDGILVGLAAGVSSAIAHAAGPIFALFLLAQRMPKDAFVASNAVFFTVVNALKLPPYAMAGLFTAETLRLDLRLLPLVPAGVLIGWTANRLLPQRHFDWVVQALLLLTSLQLVVSSLM